MNFAWKHLEIEFKKIPPLPHDTQLTNLMLNYGRQYYDEKVRSFFKTFTDSANLGFTFDWSSVTYALEHFNSQMPQGTFNIQIVLFQEQFAKFILKLFNKYKCTDELAISKVIGILHDLDNGYLPIPFSNIMKHLCTNISAAEEHSMKFPHCDNDIMILMKSRYGEFKQCWNLDPVKSALFTSRDNSLDILNKFGVSYLAPINDACEWEMAAKYVNLFRNPELVRFYTGHQLLKKIKRHYKEESLTRVLTVVRGIAVLAMTLTREQEDNSIKYVKRLKTIFQTIPEPHISSREVCEFLLQVVRRPSEIVQELTREFEYNFPESRKSKQPRSLLHLSRCQVRQNLRIAGALPYGVEKLHLPEKLEKYILLQKYEKFKPNW